MALNIWDVMFRGRALTARVKSESEGTDLGFKYTLQYFKKKKNPVVFRENISISDIPAMLMLAGVAFTDAGVLVLLLVGVTPLERQQKHYITRKNKNARPEMECRWRLLTWHRILVVVLEPAEEPIDCREHLRAIPKAIWSDGYILYPIKQNTKGKHLQMHAIYGSCALLW